MPAATPIVRGSKYCEKTPAAVIDSIITAQRTDSSVAKTRPRNSSRVCFSSWEKLSTEVTAIPTREIAISTSASQ
jgi:hypothetical protein